MNDSYTPEELAAAAAASTTVNEIVRRLGREPTPGRNRYVLDRLRTLGIDCSHLDNRPRLYSRESLAEAAAASTSINDVVRHLGAKEVGGTQAHIGRLLRRYEIDMSHFTVAKRRTVLETLDPAALVEAVGKARSVVGVLSALGLPPTDSARRHLDRECTRLGISLEGLGHRRLDISRPELAEAVASATSIPEVMDLLGLAGKNVERQVARAIDRHGLDTSHFKRRSWRIPNPRRPQSAPVLVKDAGRTNRVSPSRLRRAMTEIGIPYLCAMCGTGPTWQGHTITLEVDHIDGDITDNRARNLRFLCPNCHATTSTYCRKKSGGSRPSQTASLMDG